MAILMYCDHCEKLIDENVSGGVRLKMDRKEYVFHLCRDCQILLLKQMKDSFLKAPWREL